MTHYDKGLHSIYKYLGSGNNNNVNKGNHVDCINETQTKAFK
jgi:hypothetical protein